VPSFEGKAAENEGLGEKPSPVGTAVSGNVLVTNFDPNRDKDNPSGANRQSPEISINRAFRLIAPNQSKPVPNGQLALSRR
jgi:hypothetical protein